MAITIRDKCGTFGRKRAVYGPKLDRRSARYFAVVDNTWSRGFTLRREAEDAERDMKGRAANGVNLRAGATTVAAFLRDVWLANAEAKCARDQIKQSTLAHYRLMAERYLIPAIGKRRLRDLQPGHVRKLYADLGARGLAPKTIRNAHVALSNALGLALSDGYVARNVAKATGVDPRSWTRVVVSHAAVDAA